MIVLDVNVLVYAFDAGSAHHRRWADWLNGALSKNETIAVPDAVLSGFLRIVTDRRILSEPTSIESAMQFVTALLDAPASALLGSTRATWRALDQLTAADPAIVGDAVPDAFLAAVTISSGARLATEDRGFHRYPSLEVFSPPKNAARLIQSIERLERGEGLERELDE